MRKKSLFVAFLVCLSAGLYAQNLLSPTWKISFNNISEDNLNMINTIGWKIYPSLGHLNDKARGVQIEFLKKRAGLLMKS